MKRPAGLIILFILSSANAIYHLIRQSRDFENLETNVSQALKTLYQELPENFDLNSVPEWLASGIIECVKHYQDYGVVMFHLKTGVYVLTILAVILMFLWKKSGYHVYIVAQILNIGAIGYGYGMSTVSIMGMLIVALLSYLFIWLYNMNFIKQLKQHQVLQV